MRVDNEKKYLFSVRVLMLSYFSQKDIFKTIKDISTIYGEAQSMGKQDADIVHNLGTPRELVSELKNEETKRSFGTIIYTLLLSVVFIVIVKISLNNYQPLLWIIPSVLLPAIVWVISGGESLLAYDRWNDHKPIKYLIIISSLLIMLIQLFTIITLFKNFQSISDWMPLLSYYITVAYLLMIGFTLMIISCLIICGNYKLFEILPVCSGALFSSLSYNVFLCNMEEFVPTIGLFFVPYMVGAIVGMIMHIIIKGDLLNNVFSDDPWGS